jgi:hypothetical protein
MATRVELLLFAHGEAREPQRVVELSSEHRAGDHWHVEVEGVGLGSCYGYRVYGPLQPGGHSFNPSKVLLDPCARAIAGWQGYQRGAAVGAVAGLLVGMALWSAGNLEGQLADAHRELASLRYGAIDETHAGVAAALDEAWPLPGITARQRADLDRVLTPEQVAALNEHYGAVELALDP